MNDRDRRLNDYVQLNMDGQTYWVNKWSFVGSMLDRKLEQFRYASHLMKDVRDYSQNDRLAAERFAKLACLRAKRESD